MNNDKKNYEEIIHHPRHRSKTRPPMSRLDRAAQFSPFAALAGHSELMEETARVTEDKAILTEDEKARLNARLLLLAENLKEGWTVSITYFLPDDHKPGGIYVTETGKVKKFDAYKNCLTLESGVVVPINDIYAIEGAPF